MIRKLQRQVDMKGGRRLGAAELAFFILRMRIVREQEAKLAHLIEDIDNEFPADPSLHPERCNPDVLPDATV